MRRFFILIVILVLLAVAADRAAWWFAERSIAQEIQNTQNLSARPDVTVGGFPFLTQALRGRYKEIDADLRDPDVEGGLKIDTLKITLRGVRVATGDLINRRVDEVPVDSASAVATISFAALNAAAKENLPDTKSTVVFSQGTGNALAVKGSYRSSVVNAQLNLQARLVAKDGDLVVELAPGTLDEVPSLVRPQVQSLVARASRLPALPLGFQAKDVSVNSTGVTVRATASALNLRASDLNP
ncbi:MAG TPA: DUF2993 domain-containing protein [Kineosporiaceae bacterium]|nr:DUF2993 domain-containing protein [Kineosporiaceae bacterium]